MVERSFWVLPFIWCQSYVIKNLLLRASSFIYCWFYVFDLWEFIHKNLIEFWLKLKNALRDFHETLVSGGVVVSASDYYHKVSWFNSQLGWKFQDLNCQLSLDTIREYSLEEKMIVRWKGTIDGWPVLRESHSSCM